MKKIGIAVHGGAGPDSAYIKQNRQEYLHGIEEAVSSGYKVLERGGTSVDAVEAAVNAMENNHLFNAGKGAAINERAEVELCASIMDGSNSSSGAVAIVRGVKNPVSLARAIMQQTKHIYLGGAGARHFAEQLKMPMEPDAYFITEHAYDEYQKKKEELRQEGALSNQKMHGTVGAVALDRFGNIAAATSTGGTECCYEGRIADSSMPGIGSYANNQTCAVSTTGDGEYHIKHVSAFHIAALVEYKMLKLEDACNYLVHEKCKNENADLGLIAINTAGDIAMVFNSERMHRGWKTNESDGIIEIY